MRPHRLPRLLVLTCGFVSAVLAVPATAQRPSAVASQQVSARPVPNPVVPPLEFRRAMARGTRTASGVPGPNYWQQHARYTIAVRLDAEAKRLDGTTRIVYRNNAPDALPYVIVQLLQNYHRDDALRLARAEVTGGYAFTRVAAQGQVLDASPQPPRGPGYFVNGTSLLINLPRPVAPRDSLVIETAWSYRIPQRGVSARMGWNGDELFCLAYFYPQMTVFDDVVGWQNDPYLGVSEFYAGFADYDVTLDAPEGWLVRGTGRLLNEAEVFPEEILRRLRLAEASDTVVHVLTEQDFGPGRATRQSPDGRVRWHFAADSVRDVTFSVTRVSVWDAARAGIGDRDGDGRPDYALAEAVYRPRFARWRESARYAQHALAFHSRHTGLPYAWSHATAVESEGVMGGGMEFPMITLIGNQARASDTAMYLVVSHELAHNWAPMLVNSDERRYAWMDEGTTRYSERRALEDFFPGFDGAASPRNRYLGLARTEGEASLMRWSWVLDAPGQYPVQGYEKPATLLAALRHLLGAEAFQRAYQGYLRAWAHRHPKPWDFFNFFDASTGQDLGWFWRSWYAETWQLDQAVAAVTRGPRGTDIQVRDFGDVPMPARVLVTLANGDTLRRDVPVSTWLGGARTATVSVPRGQEVTRVEIDPEQAFPDVARKNNVWTQEAETRSVPQALFNDLARATPIVTARGYRPEGDLLLGSAAGGSTESRTVTLSGGTAYGFLAVCDAECSDIDLVLVDSSGTTVRQDRQPDDAPAFEYTPPAPGRYRLDVIMYACRSAACTWGAQVLRR